MTDQPDGDRALRAASDPAVSSTVSAAAMLSTGADMWTTRGDETLGLTAMRLSDGPNGVRGPTRDERHPAICTPCGTALASSWDESLLRRVGRLVAAEARRQDVDVVLGPTMNIARSPLGGRAFESFSEDPLLSGRLAAAWVAGVQAGGVSACPKHFVANDSETSRTTVDCVVDERALREIYLAPFEHVLRPGGAWAVMASYNKINGTYACENRQLLRDVVKSEWGWDGVVVSDWYAARDTVACGRAGLDLEMPGPGRVFGRPLAEAVHRGLVGRAELEDKVERLRRLADRTRRAPAEPGSDILDARADRLLVEAAADGMVLLKNDRGVLPLSVRDHAPGRPVHVALLGAHALHPCLQGGGSAEVSPRSSTRTVAEALRDRFGDDVVLTVETGSADGTASPPLERLDLTTRAGSGTPGVRVRYVDEDGRTTHEETRLTSSLVWDDGIPGLGPRGGHVEASGVLTPHVAGTYVFSVRGSGETRLSVDGHLVAALPNQSRTDDPQAPYFGDVWAQGAIDLLEDVPVLVTVEMDHRVIGETLPVMRFGCRPPAREDELEAASSAARSADVAVVVVGTGRDREAESTDRDSTALPAQQDALVRSVLRVQPRTVVIINAGAPVDLPWEDRAAAIVYAWFPGDGFADALVSVLAGDREPGGRLPLTLAAHEHHYPALATAPDEAGRLVYAESVLVGYRHFDAAGHRAAFSFGHGLGYTRFDFLQLTLLPPKGSTIGVAVTLRNSGDRRGKEVVQLYVAPPPCPVDRPPRELKAFGVARLEPGETGVVDLELDARAFSYWDVDLGRWRIEPGRYDLLAGRSSTDLRLGVALLVDGEDPAGWTPGDGATKVTGRGPLGEP